MYDYFYRVYEAIIQSVAGELILFFVIVGASLIPCYKMIFSDRKHRREYEAKAEEREQERIEQEQKRAIEREKATLSVIKENSAAIAGHTAATNTLISLIGSHNADMKQGIGRIHDRIGQENVRMHQRLDQLQDNSARIISALEKIDK